MALPAQLTPPTDQQPDAGLRAGFVLYVGLSTDSAGVNGRVIGELAEVAEALRDLARDLLPTAETFTALSLVPRPAAPDDVQTLRARLAHLRPLVPTGGAAPRPDEGRAPTGATGGHRRPALVSVPSASPSGPVPGDGADDDGRGVRIDLGSRRVHVGGRPVPLTYKEFELLSHLVRAPHRVVGRAELLRTVWHGTAQPGTRTVDVHVRRLREKVSGDAITTVRGVGYRFDPSPEIVLTGSGDAG